VWGRAKYPLKGGMDLERLALILVIVGAINWLLVGLFQLDVVSALFNGPASYLSRAVYILIGIAGVWTITLLFTDRERVR